MTATDKKGQSRYIDKKTRDLLFVRSKGLCECCGIDITSDKHHILELAEDGKNSFDNLIVLCPSCHRQIPTLLNRRQQVELQLWHRDNLHGNKSVSHQIFSQFNQFKIGSNFYNNCTRIFVIDGQNIITPYLRGDRFYLNIIMLHSFVPKLLILSNRIIINDDDLSLSVGANFAEIKNQDKSIFSIERQNDNLINVNMTFKYTGKDFIFAKNNTSYPGFFINNSYFNVRTAIIYNTNGPNIIGSSK